MPDYTSLATEITAIKTEIAASIGHTTYSAQDLVYLASALDTLGGMLGVKDIVAATADKIADLETKKVASLASMETARVGAVADVVAERATAISNITTRLNGSVKDVLLQKMILYIRTVLERTYIFSHSIDVDSSRNPVPTFIETTLQVSL